MTVGSLFAGIGGFELAATWAGMTPVWSNEIDPFCCAVLRKNFNHEIIEADIRTIGKHNLKPVDILTGGFPCQPYSTAGKRKGTEDSRHLWPEMHRTIDEIRPTFIVGENVLGLLNWNGGLVLKQIKNDLEDSGYCVLPPFVLPACGKDAGHKRERIWIVAYLNIDRFNRKRKKVKPTKERFKAFSKPATSFATDINSLRIQRQLQEKIYRIEGTEGRQTQQQPENGFQLADTFEPKLCRTLHGIPFGVDRIKSLGNSIVPQVAFEIFKAIKATTK